MSATSIEDLAERARARRGGGGPRASGSSSSGGDRAERRRSRSIACRVARTSCTRRIAAPGARRVERRGDRRAERARSGATSRVDRARGTTCGSPRRRPGRADRARRARRSRGEELGAVARVLREAEAGVHHERVARHAERDARARRRAPTRRSTSRDHVAVGVVRVARRSRASRSCGPRACMRTSAAPAARDHPREVVVAQARDVVHRAARRRRGTRRRPRGSSCRSRRRRRDSAA